MNYDSEKIKKMLLTLLFVALGVIVLRFLLARNSETLMDYATKNPEKQVTVSSESSQSSTASEVTKGSEETEVSTEPPKQENALLTGATLNTSIPSGERIEYAENFYVEPLSDNLKRYMTGVSYPSGNASSNTLAITLDDLYYMHILHYDFSGQPVEGELICNKKIANDLLEIFYELYTNEYQIEKVTLIDEYDGDDTASMLDNNTSCFNYRVVEGSTSLSKHAYGFALDINPFYNPYITYEKDGSTHISPEGSEPYADRKADFPYKIDENDLCYKLFTQHGFTWGGNWNSCKDYQHFQKVVK